MPDEGLGLLNSTQTITFDTNSVITTAVIVLLAALLFVGIRKHL